MIALDLSRLLSRAGRETPTGIDRVELAYAEHLIAHGAAACFAALSARGGLGLLEHRAAEQFVADLNGIVDGIIPTCLGDVAGDMELLEKIQHFRS